jgi:hypothetical protein
MIILGNSSVTELGCAVTTITSISDRRVKTNVQNIDSSLSFIMRLQPVTYHLSVESMDSISRIGNPQADSLNTAERSTPHSADTVLHNGFIAQAVDSAAQLSGYPFSGISRPNSPAGTYGLGYSDLIPALTKAIQQQQAIISALQTQNSSLQAQINSMQAILNRNNLH